MPERLAGSEPNAFDDDPRVAIIMEARQIMSEIASTPALRAILQRAFADAKTALDDFVAVRPYAPEALEKFRSAHARYWSAINVGLYLKEAVLKGQPHEIALAQMTDGVE